MLRALVAIFSLLLLTGASAPDAGPRVHLAQGDLIGIVEGTSNSFRGIPYAAPPLGPLRWRAPQPAPSWSGARDASAFGPVCPQSNAEGMVARFHLPKSEDCLTLNLWLPQNAGTAKLPVMVFIHGGGFRFGGSSAPIYDGVELAAHGVIVVSFNYRLGRLGFFAFPPLRDEHKNEAFANYALLDQIAALTWVRNNIAAFGGDPSNVTIFGESSGAASVDTLMVSPLARGLFERAISESGPMLGASEKLDNAERDAVAFAAKSNISASDPKALEKLRAIDADTIADADPLDTDFTPIIDGTVVPQSPDIAFARGEIAHVPYLSGWNSDEASLLRGGDASFVANAYGGSLAAMRAVYERNGKMNDADFNRALFTDGLFGATVQAFSAFADRAGLPTYAYHFAFLADILRRRGAPGVPHGAEMRFVFGFGALGALAPGVDTEMSQTMQSYWTNFAKTGDPNGKGLPEWPRFTVASRKTLVIGDTIAPVSDFRAPEIGATISAWSKSTGEPRPY